MADQQFPEGVEVIRVGDEQGRGGLYNMMVPNAFERGQLLLPLIGGFEQFSDLGRFRDVWVERDDQGALSFHVYTRNGGGNRPDYAEAIERMRAHPLYLRDADDAFDATYASFWFRVPEEFTETLGVAAVPPVDTAERWKKISEALYNAGG